MSDPTKLTPEELAAIEGIALRLRMPLATKEHTIFESGGNPIGTLWMRAGEVVKIVNSHERLLAHAAALEAEVDRMRAAIANLAAFIKKDIAQGDEPTIEQAEEWVRRLRAEAQR